MTAALTLPGTIPGLLRRGSPVTLRPRVYGDVSLMHGGQGVVHDAARGVAVVDTFGGSPRVVRYGREDVALDLSDPTGRAHAAWWLALRECPASHVLDPAAVAWHPAPAQADAGWALEWHARAAKGDGSLTGHWWSGRPRSPVPARLLWHLVRHDPTRLPDGSRWVDAEALRLVCLHVAGVAP